MGGNERVIQTMRPGIHQEAKSRVGRFHGPAELEASAGTTGGEALHLSRGWTHTRVEIVGRRHVNQIRRYPADAVEVR